MEGQFNNIHSDADTISAFSFANAEILVHR